ncbi:MAG: head-tail connector protein [Holosporaceae bacterium]|jgi:hypothetical protein|nr:head-tail connector protein [Holosporaceae bacterium]
MQLVLIKEPESEIITLEEAKEYLRIDHDFDNALISNLIKTTRETMESIIQKSVLRQTWEYILDNDSVRRFDPDSYDHPSIFCDITRIPLPKSPVIRVISVFINEYKLEERCYSPTEAIGRSYLCINSDKFLEYKEACIKITYESGISEKLEKVPYQLKLANLMLLANAYQDRFSPKQEGIVSPGVKQLLSPFINLRIA